jgi:hypothetical protein
MEVSIWSMVRKNPKQKRNRSFDPTSRPFALASKISTQLAVPSAAARRIADNI